MSIISASQEQSIPTLNSTLGVPDEVFAGRELDEIKPDFHGAPEIRPNSASLYLDISNLVVWL